MPIYSDSFQRTNENPLASLWIWFGGYFQLLNNQVQPQFGGASGYGGAYMYYGATLTDQFSQVVVKNVGTSPSCAGPAVRMSVYNGGNAWYQFVTEGPLGSPAYVMLEKYLPTGGSYLSYAIATVNSGDTLKLTAVGNVLTCYINGKQVLQASDSDLSSGWPGLAAYAASLSSDAQLGAWSGGSIDSSLWPGLIFTSIPDSSTSSGMPGQVAYDSNYLYICTAMNSWSRSLLSSL